MNKILYSLFFAVLMVTFFNCSKQTTVPVYEYPDTYDISLLEVSQNYFNTSDYTENARAIQVVGDTLLFVHSRGNNKVISFSLEIKGDISSAVFQQSFSTENYIGSTAQGEHGHGFFIRQNDLKKMWLFNRTEIWEFDLEEAGKISSGVYSDYLDLTDYVERGHGIYFHPKGTHLYIDDRNKEMIHQFSLSVAWSISCFDGYVTLDISDNHEAVRAVSFHPNGSHMYLLDTDLQQIQHYQLSRPWQIESVVFHQKLTVSISNPRSFAWNSDGTIAYVMNTDDGVIYEFVMGE